MVLSNMVVSLGTPFHCIEISGSKLQIHSQIQPGDTAGKPAVGPDEAASAVVSGITVQAEEWLIDYTFVKDSSGMERNNNMAFYWIT